MKKQLFLILLFLISSLVFTHAQKPGKKLTHWLSAEDRIKWEDVGKGFIETDPAKAPIRNVAEFDRMQGVLIAYETNHFGIPTTLIKEMAEDVRVTTIVENESQKNSVIQIYQNAGVNLDHCDFLTALVDSYWTRDYGPWFISDSLNNIGIVDFPYNRPQRPNDDNIPVKLADMLGIPWYGMNVIHTGGNYMTDGLGISSSTDLVEEENDPELTPAQIAQKMHDYLGINNYMVVPDPNGTYIDHIDCWGKFLSPDRILIRKVPSTHPRYTAIEATASYYAQQICSYGYPYRVYRVNTPDDQPYTNSVILNNKVLVPVMNSAWDDSALSAYRNALPGYEVLGFIGNPGAPWESTDALHCRVMGVADLGQLYIKHIPLSGVQPAQDNFLIQADLIRCSDSAAYSDSVLIWYNVNEGPFCMRHMTRISGDHYEGMIPKQPTGSIIKYYLYAADKSGRNASCPYIGAADPFSFTTIYSDLTSIPDTLRFNSFEDCMNGKTFTIHNFTSSTININNIEEMGFFVNGGGIAWAVDPDPVSSYPHPVNAGDSLPCRVVILLPLQNTAGGFLIDTLHFISETDTHSVIIMVNDSLITKIRNEGKSAGKILVNNFPNPFSESTLIHIVLNSPMNSKVEIVEMTGKIVKTLSDGFLTEGDHQFSWNGTDESGKQLHPGIYLVRFSGNEVSFTRKMMLIR